MIAFLSACREATHDATHSDIVLLPPARSVQFDGSGTAAERHTRLAHIVTYRFAHAGTCTNGSATRFYRYGLDR